MLQSGLNLYRRSGFAITPPANVWDRNLRSPLATGGTFLLIADVAYFLYIGQMPHTRVPKYVEVNMTTVGTGAQTAEVGLFSSTGPPNKGSLSLSKIVATGTVDTLTATLVTKRNTSAFTTPVYAETYLWAGIRTNMGGNQPTFRGIENDFSQGYQLSTATAGALTGAGPWTGAIIGGVTVAPAIRVVFD